ncbi:MAG: 2-succinyl-5-enolpyruvyl-6-hydroxy-3-cyclohexene-1-carboxylic-acid synthase, partial [Flavobacteriales bacterium]|nr:2-succinyl-5-enolpyruvyl-6-hydroxy-3-cyclohexene-1-carboxylic-acid synthase [Flavobacteriales bacterium]
MAPLSYSFYHHPDFTVWSVPDERVAGYMALGMCQQLGEPVAITCTSGTAPYNYGPAVAEAYFQKSPLIVLSADRPEEWVAQGEGQTIHQKDLFGKHVLYSAQLNEDLGDEHVRKFNRRKIHEAWERCLEPSKGPVQLNLAFREPLYEFTDELPNVLPKRTLPMRHELPQDQWDSLISRLSTYSKIMLIITQNGGITDSTAMDKVASWPNTLVLTETTSNTHSKHAIPCIDRLLENQSAEQLEELKPELIITIGHNIISKKLRNLIRSSDALHWHVDESDRFLDTF